MTSETQLALFASTETNHAIQAISHDVQDVLDHDSFLFSLTRKTASQITKKELHHATKIIKSNPIHYMQRSPPTIYTRLVLECCTHANIPMITQCLLPAQSVRYHITEALDSYNNTALHYILAASNLTENHSALFEIMLPLCPRMLLKKNDQHISPLHQALSKGYFELIETAFNIVAKFEDSLDPYLVHHAALEFLQLLINVPQNKWTSIHRGFFQNAIQTVASKAAVLTQIRSADKQSLISTAVRAGNWEALALLIQASQATKVLEKFHVDYAIQQLTLLSHDTITKAHIAIFELLAPLSSLYEVPSDWHDAVIIDFLHHAYASFTDRIFSKNSKLVVAQDTHGKTILSAFFLSFSPSDKLEIAKNKKALLCTLLRAFGTKPFDICDSRQRSAIDYCLQSGLHSYVPETYFALDRHNFLLQFTTSASKKNFGDYKKTIFSVLSQEFLTEYNRLTAPESEQERLALFLYKKLYMPITSEQHFLSMISNIMSEGSGVLKKQFPALIEQSLQQAPKTVQPILQLALSLLQETQNKQKVAEATCFTAALLSHRLATETTNETGATLFLQRNGGTGYTFLMKEGRRYLVTPQRIGKGAHKNVFLAFSYVAASNAQPIIHAIAAQQVREDLFSSKRQTIPPFSAPIDQVNHLIEMAITLRGEKTIAEIYDVFFDESKKRAIIMTELHNENLLEAIEQGHIWPEENPHFDLGDHLRSLIIYHDIARGLTSLHAKNIVLVDAKPENCVVTPDEYHIVRAKITDTDCAQKLENEQDSPELLCTRSYMSPELRREALSPTTIKQVTVSPIPSGGYLAQDLFPMGIIWGDLLLKKDLFVPFLQHKVPNAKNVTGESFLISPKDIPHIKKLAKRALCPQFTVDNEKEVASLITEVIKPSITLLTDLLGPATERPKAASVLERIERLIGNVVKRLSQDECAPFLHILREKRITYIPPVIAEDEEEEIVHLTAIATLSPPPSSMMSSTSSTASGVAS